MNDRMRKGCCRLLTLLLTLVLVIPAYGQETLDALAAAQGCTAETLLQSDKLTAGDSVSDWVAIAVSRAGTEGDTSAYRKALERYVTRMYREQGGLDRLRATEWQRTALTALALGADPTAFGRDKNGRSVNLLADGVYQFTAAKSLGTQGLNGWIFGLIALDSARFAVPEDAVYTRATILQALVAAQEPEGGFGLTVGNSDVDLTAMTLQALAPYQNSTVTYTGTSGESVTIREVVRRALAWLSDQQTAEGDFISWDAANLESTAQVIIALCSLGVDPATDARFVKNGISAVDGLMRYRLDDGTFRHILTDGSDVMATEQALLAQEAMERLSAARRSLYDFREEMPEDVKTQVTALNEALTGQSTKYIQLLHIVVHENNVRDIVFLGVLGKAFCQHQRTHTAATDNSQFHCDNPFWILVIRFVHSEHAIDCKYDDNSKQDKHGTQCVTVTVVIFLKCNFVYV